MDIDEDDDLYQPDEPKIEGAPLEEKPKAEDLEEGEEEDEGAAMDEDDDDDDDSVRELRHLQTHQLTLIAGYRHYHRTQRWHQTSTSTVRDSFMRLWSNGY